VGTFRLYVRFPDGEIWHGCYDSVTDTAARFLTPTADDVAGWAMEDDYREDGDLDGRGDPVDIATDYDDFHWHGTALRLPGPGRWCWLTGPVSCDDETTIWERPGWLDEHMARKVSP
jgi:hypothetical protein